MRLAGLVDPVGRRGRGAVVRGRALRARALTSPAAALEFSTPAPSSRTRPCCSGRRADGRRRHRPRRRAGSRAVGQGRASGAGLVVVPNFSLGAVLLMRFAAEAARHYEHAEIIEIHEEAKVDAPSGTSLRTARLMAEAPGSALAARPAPARRPAGCGGRQRSHPQRAPARRGRPPGSPVRRRRRAAHVAPRFAVARSFMAACCWRCGAWAVHGNRRRSREPAGLTPARPARRTEGSMSGASGPSSPPW